MVRWHRLDGIGSMVLTGKATVMKTRSRWAWLLSAAMGLAMALLTGCQTWVPTAGLTLPSGQYLRHPPQYIPPSPAFPLTNELSSLEEAHARQNAGPLLP